MLFSKMKMKKNIDEVFLFKAQNEDMEKNFICDILKKIIKKIIIKIFLYYQEQIKN